ncbi:magnesium chelatase subunit D family protein [Actinokineospora iranica]|uniref:Mg-protoporphyrin IX chelatase n=1 Tax=Actinokineospora iranica TaxID=1271860 RepID=A0A1G6J503_9PSEU|nr:magnesium chelatase subunit D family protein [Actinokineospora iranica]SDC13709.1 protoporphyrin IX magnesium-chelatase [Actinokineospora iranica]
MSYPFSAVVGHDDLRLSLLLNAVHPGIGGVLVRGEKGTAKSTVVRALAALLPEADVVAECRFSCDPAVPDPRCPDGPHVGAESDTRAARLVELPVGATEDRLIGSLDLERALTEGVRAYQPGLLAAAHRGVLYVDEVNLLHDHLVDLLLDAAAMGRAHVEREGVSVTHAAAFLLVGTMNPEEGELRPQLLDRFGLTVEVRAARDVTTRTEVIRRRLAFEADPAGFAARWSSADADLAAKIVAARKALPEVALPDSELRRIAAVCAAFDVDGMRADLVLARTAMAHAAWRGSTAVEEIDVAVSARLALPHRRRRDPFDQPGIEQAHLEQALRHAAQEADRDPDPDGPTGGAPTPESACDQRDNPQPGTPDAPHTEPTLPGGHPRSSLSGSTDENGARQRPVDNSAVDNWGDSPDGVNGSLGANGGRSYDGQGPGEFGQDNRGRGMDRWDNDRWDDSGWGDNRSGNGGGDDRWDKDRSGNGGQGKDSRGAAGEGDGGQGGDGQGPGGLGSGNLAEGTSVAPDEAFRARVLEIDGVGEGAPGRRSRSRGGAGRALRSSATQGSGVHLVGTLIAAAPFQRDRGRSGPGLLVRSGDVRHAVREGRESNLVLFAVDASGSMAARKRMSAVTGAVISLLRDAYQRRDKVGLVTFRGAESELALPPTSSVEAAVARLRHLRTGGRTPLADGLMRARKTLATERLRDPRRRALLVVVTDGRATVPLSRNGSNPVRDSLRAASLLAGDGIASVVVDCESGPVRLGLANTLAVALRGTGLRLEELSADSVAGVVRAARAA